MSARPRVAYLLKKFPRLSETFILNELLAQEARGLDLHVFSRRAPDDEPRHAELARLRAPVEEVPDRRERNAFRLLLEEAAREPATLERFQRVLDSGLVPDAARLESLAGEVLYLLTRCRELGIEHVHTHFATESAIVACLLQRVGGPSYSVTVHAKDIFRSTVDHDRLSTLFEEARFVVTVCDANVRYLTERVRPTAAERVRRLYNGIDVEAFANGGTAREERTVLAVGRLVEKKGFDVLVRAAALLRDRHVDARFLVVGDGDQREELEAQIGALGLQDRVELLGARDQDEVRRLMSSATLLCQPCVEGDDGNRDALPTVLLEALAAGLPAISTPVTGIPEILDEGRAGVLVPERDARATASAIEELLRDDERRAALAAAGPPRARALFDRRKAAVTLGAWLDDAVGAAGRPCGSST